MAVARGVNEVDAVETSRIPRARVALACIALIHHVFDLWMESLVALQACGIVELLICSYGLHQYHFLLHHILLDQSRQQNIIGDDIHAIHDPWKSLNILPEILR